MNHSFKHPAATHSDSDRASRPKRLLARPRPPLEGNPADALLESRDFAHTEKLQSPMDPQALHEAIQQARAELSLKNDETLRQQRILLEEQFSNALETRVKLLEIIHERQVSQLQAIINELSTAMQSIPQLALEHAVELASVGLAYLIEKEDVSRSAIRASMQYAMEAATPLKPVKAHLHPEDFALMKSIGCLDSDTFWSADDLVERSACRIDTQGGEVEARLSDRLQHLFKLWQFTVSGSEMKGG